MNASHGPEFPYGTATLRYRLVAGQVDLAPLHVLASRCTVWRQWEVTFSVLGASHAVTLARGEKQLTELLACTIGGEGLTPIVEIDAMQAMTLRASAQGLACTITLIPFSLEENSELASKFETDCQLHVEYPTSLYRATPYTWIGWRVTAEALSVETLHTYPEENRAVRSSTVYRED